MIFLLFVMLKRDLIKYADLYYLDLKSPSFRELFFKLYCLASHSN